MLATPPCFKTCSFHLNAHPIPVYLSVHFRVTLKPRGANTLKRRTMALSVPRAGLASMMKEGAKVRVSKIR